MIKEVNSFDNDSFEINREAFSSFSLCAGANNSL